MRYRKFPWQRNFAKVPASIIASLARIDARLILVADTKVIPIAEIECGQYKHVGLTAKDGEVRVGDPQLPPSSSGKWSQRNVEGWERKRTDLPKTTKTYSWETPNFGDAATYGTHTTSRTREVYQVEFDEPRGHEIAVEILKQGEGDPPSVVVKFSIVNPIDRDHEHFEKELLWALNVLQENVGVCGVYKSTARRQDYLNTIALSWEVFPPGTADEIIAVFRKRRGGRTTKDDAIVDDRLKLFASLKPTAYLAGTAKFSSYVGAQFAPDLVVFENVRYGNALYVLYDDWQEVSKRSRIDLLKGTSEKFDRFVHTDGWGDRFLDHIKWEIDRRKPRKK
jgi:hypothetical protein